MCDDCTGKLKKIICGLRFAVLTSVTIEVTQQTMARINQGASVERSLRLVPEQTLRENRSSWLNAILPLFELCVWRYTTGFGVCIHFWKYITCYKRKGRHTEIYKGMEGWGVKFDWNVTLPKGPLPICKCVSERLICPYNSETRSSFNFAMLTDPIWEPRLIRASCQGKTASSGSGLSWLLLCCWCWWSPEYKKTPREKVRHGLPFQEGGRQDDVLPGAGLTHKRPEVDPASKSLGQCCLHIISERHLLLFRSFSLTGSG